MARYSGAAWMPVAWANARDDNTDATVVILHVTASNADSQYGFFNGSRTACSHFHVALDGDVEQYIDTSKLSAADYEGSDNAISIETSGTGEGSWTRAQLESLRKLLAWINKTHGIPLKLKTTSDTSPGIGWHRLGITGNFPALPSLLAGRNQRGMAGEAWSTSGGKVCPGDKRILQLPELVAAAGGAPTEQEFLMALSDREQDVVLAGAEESVAKVRDGERWLPNHEAQRVEIALLRRIEGRIVADQVTPVEVDVEIDADAVAEALVAKLPAPVALAVLDAMAARLDK